MSSNWKPRNKPEFSNGQQEDLRLIGCIAKPRGLHGDFFLNLESDLTEWLITLREVFSISPGGLKSWTVKTWKKVGPRLTLSLEELPDRTAVESCQGLELYVKEKDAREACGEDFFFNSDLVGLEVQGLDEGGNPSEPLGKIIAVHDMPAHHQLEIEKMNGTRFLLPFVDQLVPEIDLKAGILFAHIPEGLDKLE